MNINLTPIIQALIGLLAAFLTYRIIPMIKAKTTNAQREQIAAAIRIAVFAAEQVYGAGHGPEKMDYAIRYLHDKGYDVDEREVEAAVGRYINIDEIIDGLFEAKSVPPDEIKEDNEETVENPAE